MKNPFTHKQIKIKKDDGSDDVMTIDNQTASQMKMSGFLKEEDVVGNSTSDIPADLSQVVATICKAKEVISQLRSQGLSDDEITREIEENFEKYGLPKL